jgi:hypothetical protein
MVKSKSFLFSVVFFLLQASAWAQGCSICKAALTNSPEGRALAGAFRHGIVVLLATPYLILGAIGFAFYRAYRKKAAEQPKTLLD